MFIAKFAVLRPFRARAFGCHNPGGWRHRLISLYRPDTWWTGVRRHGGHFL